MREFSINIEEHFTNGLRRDPRSRRNQVFSKESKGVVSRGFGLEGFEGFYDPFEGNINTAFPYPQIIRMKGDTLLGLETDLNLVDESTFPWTASAVDASPLIPVGGAWEVIDFKEAYYLLNGSCIIAKIKDNDQYLVYSATDARTGLNFKGRSVIGGINPNKMFTGMWDNIFYNWREKVSFLPDHVASDPDASYVMWGSIGGGDFPLWMFQPKIMLHGNLEEKGGYETIDESYLMDRIRMNQFGFMPMPFQGDVLNIRELGNGVIVFGEDGIVYLPSFDGRTVGNEQIPPTFGMQNVESFGIAERSAVGGDTDGYMFVDDSGDLWVVTPELETTRLGYREYIYPMIGNDIRISKDKRRDVFYIASNDRCYAFGNGLTRVDEYPTSLYAIKGGDVALFGEDTEKDILIVTNSFDMKFTGVKTISNIDIAYESNADLEVAVDFRYNYNEPFQRTRFQKVNIEGNAFLRVHGLEFRIVIKCSDKTDFVLDYATVRYQADDKRNVRGLGAAQSSS